VEQRKCLKKRETERTPLSMKVGAGTIKLIVGLSRNGEVARKKEQPHNREERI